MDLDSNNSWYEIFLQYLFRAEPLVDVFDISEIVVRYDVNPFDVRKGRWIIRTKIS